MSEICAFMLVPIKCGYHYLVTMYVLPNKDSLLFHAHTISMLDYSCP